MPEKKEKKTKKNIESVETSVESKAEEKIIKKHSKGKKIAKLEKKLSEKDYEKEVLELAKQGLTSEKIGESLRKKGIHPKEYNKKISKILKENNAYEDPELKNIQTKFERIEAHSKKNKQDKRAVREKSRIFSQRRKIKKYLKMPLK